MGNHLLKSNKPPKGEKDGVVLRNRHNKNNGDFKAIRDKHQSCPEFGGAIPYNDKNYSVTADPETNRSDDDVKVEIKIYRSYGDLDRFRQELARDQSNPDIRVYKRSNTSIAAMSSTASLPKDFGGKNLTKQQKKMLLNGNLGNSPAHDTSVDDVDAENTDIKLSPQHRSAPNISVRKNANGAFRYPGPAEVKRKLNVFENRFRKSLTFKFLSMEEGRLLDMLSLARDLESHGMEVSVRQYLLGRGVPADLPPDQYVLTVPPALYRLLSHVRWDGIVDRKLWKSLARDILTAVGDEAGKGLSRIYEYQIVMLLEDVAIQLLASHAADCVIEYVTRKRVLLDRNSALRGVVSARPARPDKASTMFSVILGEKEHKWDLFDILKKPGIRKDIFFKDTDGIPLGMDSPFPWRFFSNRNDCDPAIYGYRGQMLEWDFVNEVFRMFSEEKLYSEEKSFNRNDFHQSFVPYKILVGVEIMRDYLEHIASVELPGRPNVSLTEYYKHTVPYTGDKRHQQMVYRPLAQLGSDFTWKGAVLEDMDLTRLNLGDHPGQCQSLRGSVLLMADCREATVAATDTEGCDLSYAVIDKNTKAPGNGNGSVGRFLLIEDQRDDGRNERDVVTDADGNSMPPSEVILARLKADPNISPEKDSFTSIDYNYNMAAPSLSSRDTQGEKRRLNNSGGPKQHKNKQRKITSLMNKSAESSRPQAHSSPSHSSDSSQSPSRSDATASTSASDVMEKTEIVFADATPTYAELRAKRAGAPVLMFPPPPNYSPSKQSQDTTASPMSSTDTSPLSDTLPPAVATPMYQIQPPEARSTLKAPEVRGNRMVLKKPIRKRQSLRGLEDTPGAALMSKLCDDLSPLYGRDEEIMDVSDAVAMNTRLVTITGCPGIGKSSVAIAVARKLNISYDFLPLFVDVRGCLTSDQVRAKIVRSLGLRLSEKYFHLIGNWLGSHNRKILLLVDNLDLPRSELDGFSDLLPAILSSNKVFLLCTSRRSLYGGDFGVTDYKLCDIEEASCELLRDMVPDLPDSCVQELAAACGYVPYTVALVGSALKHPDVSAQQLYQTLLSQTHASVNVSTAMREQLLTICSDEDEELACRLFTVVEAVVQQMPLGVRRLLSCLSCFQSPFDRAAAKAVIADMDLEDRLPDLPYSACTCYGGLLDKDPTGECLFVPHLVQLVMQTQSYVGSNSNSSSAEFKYYTYYIEKVARLCQRYHSRDYIKALTDIWKDYENILDALKRAMYDSRELYESCAILANPEMCIFLYESLEESDYLDIYQCLMDVTKQWGDCNVDRCILCCFAYFHLRSENFEEASSLVDEAMELFPKPSPTMGPRNDEEVFAIMLTLYRGVLDWKIEVDEDDDEALEIKADAVEKIKRSLDGLKLNAGLQSPLTLYAYETYALVEKERGNYQKSRHFYNVLDFVSENVLGRHPALLEGYDARRAIWERQGLFCRAAEVAKRASEVAMAFYGEHPYTAELYSKWVDCLVKVGDIQEAIHAADVALAIRERLFVDHLNTVLSNKMVAYLNLRCSLYDDAVKHAHRALEISRRLRLHEAYVTDIETILAQSQRRKDSLDSSVDSHENSKVHRHKAQVHAKTQSLHIPSHRPQKPMRAGTHLGCKREAATMNADLRPSMSTAV